MRICLAWCLLLLLAAAAPADKQPADGRPNIVLLVLESVRRDHVGCYGYPRATTPSLDTLARTGVRFEDAVASSGWTMPAMMTLFTSLSPAAHRVNGVNTRLDGEVRTLASELRRAGYHTVGITTNPQLTERFGYGRGFEEYDDYTFIHDFGSLLFESSQSGESVLERSTSKPLVRLAVHRLARLRQKAPFFLFLFFFDPHYDYLPPTPFDEAFTNPDYSGAHDGRGITRLRSTAMGTSDKEHLMALYDGEIAHTDSQIGVLLQALREHGLFENTVIVATSDHGEEFWDHGRMTHGHTLYEELVRVPLIMHLPHSVGAGLHVTNHVSHADIMPTLLHLVGHPVPDQCEGLSLLPLIHKPDVDVQSRITYLASQVDGHLIGARSAGQKIIESHDAAVVEMYDLRQDPWERNNLADSARRAEFAQLYRALWLWKRSQPLGSASEQETLMPDLSPEMKRQLESLGYTR